MEGNVRYILCDNSGAILYCYYTLGLEEVMYKAEKLSKTLGIHVRVIENMEICIAEFKGDE